MRLAFLGTPDFAVQALAAIVAAGHEVACVYSQPPAPRGRGHELKPSPVHAFAHPLLTTIALILPLERAMFSRETRTGAACARFVVNTAAADAGCSDAMTARSGRPFALIPHEIPAARKPRGAATLPWIFS